MSEKVLIVDDDPNVLKAYERRLRRRFDVETALCSEEGITAVEFLGPFAVVVSDMMMPRENGADFLARLLRTAPDSVRIMLTGNADQQTAADAINKGRVFRFLNKPCEAEELEAAIEQGIAEHRRLRTEREVLSQTVSGAVDLMGRVLALANPEAFSRGVRWKQIAADLAAAGEWGDSWRHETAALLSQVGSIAHPPSGGEEPASQPATTSDHAAAAAELVSAIPKLEGIAQVIAALDAVEFGDDDQAEADGPRSSVAFGARLLRLVRDYDALVHESDRSPREALAELLGDGPADRYEQEAIDALKKLVAAEETQQVAELMVEQLADGMRLVDDVKTAEGALLVARGLEVTPTLRRRLANYARTHAVRQPLRVLLTPVLMEKLELAAAAG